MSLVAPPEWAFFAEKDAVPVSTMLDRGAVKIVAHRRFSEEYRKLNGPR